MVEAKIDPEKKVLFLLLFIILIAGIYSTYAYFSAQGQSETQEVTTGTMNLIFDDKTNIIRNENIVPILDADIFTKATKKSFSIKNTGNLPLTMKISLTSIEITEDLKSPEFKWALYEGNTKLIEDSFDKLKNNTFIDLKSDIPLEINETKTYDLYIWIHETNKPQNELQEGNLSAIITVTTVQ